MTARVVVLAVVMGTGLWAAAPEAGDVAAARAWLSGGVPFSFVYANESSRGLLPRWKVETQRRGRETRRTYRDPKSGLAVEWVLREYVDFPAYEWVLYLRNQSDRDTAVIEKILPLDAVIGRGGVLEYARGSHDEARDFEPLARRLAVGDSLRLAPYGGRSSDGYLPFFQLLHERGVSATVGIGWTGQWAAEFRHQAAGVRAAAGMERTRFRLHPGEEVRTPSILIQFWKGGGSERGRNLWRSLLLAHYTPKVERLPVALSVHGVYGFEKTTEANMLDAVEQAARRPAGYDTFWIDAGWQKLVKSNWAASVGNFEVDGARFPRGLGPIGAAAHSKGMKFLVWLEPERVMPGTWMARTHPEWLIQPPGSIPVSEAYMRRDGFQLLDLSKPEVLRWLTDWTSRWIADSGIDIYRQDFNMYPLEYWRAGEAEDRQGIREIRYITNLYAFWDELRRRRPGLLIDNCASGGRRIDIEMLRRSVVLWRTDRVWENLAATQSIAAGLSRWIPVHSLGALVTEPYAFRSGLGTAATFPFDFRSDAVFAEARPAVAAYRETQKLYEGDFHLLTAWSLAPDVWLAWQYDRDGEGLLQAFRREGSAVAEQTYRLRGLEAAATYRVADQDGGVAVERTGRALMSEGLRVRLEQPRSAKVLVYRRLSRR